MKANLFFAAVVAFVTLAIIYSASIIVTAKLDALFAVPASSIEEAR